MNNLTETLSIELALKEYANVVSPGQVPLKRLRVGGVPRRNLGAGQHIPLGRVGTPTDIAAKFYISYLMPEAG